MLNLTHLARWVNSLINPGLNSTNQKWKSSKMVDLMFCDFERWWWERKFKQGSQCEIDYFRDKKLCARYRFGWDPFFISNLLGNILRSTWHTVIQVLKFSSLPCLFEHQFQSCWSFVFTPCVQLLVSQKPFWESFITPEIKQRVLWDAICG